ncbi:hypothetical protein OIU78_025568 [Salix suchowensis]|nr:hypothetical protein OIU78_025568 [Salix suchowensis]
MDTTPPSHKSNPNSQAKSASRLSRITNSIEPEAKTPQLSLDLIPFSDKKTPSSLSLKPSSNSLSLQELLLSPSPLRKSRTRLADRYEMPEEGVIELNGSRRRCKSRGSPMGSLGCASPRSNRRLRRRLEVESREERDLIGFVDEVGKVRKRRHSSRSKKEKEKEKEKEKLSSLPSSSTTPKVDGGNLERVGMVVYDLIMWEDVAKSSLWFGLGCLCFLSSCFAKGINFSIFSAISQLGLLFLGASFFSNSICQRNSVENLRKFKLTEDDILRVGRLILPAANLAISKTRELFSGEPSMTLKVIPFLLLGAEYGHLLTLRRLCGIGFFICFTIPKLYACYCSQINQKVEHMKCRVLTAWGACSHKKMVAASAVTAFWNLSSVKTRIFTAFVSLVILRCCRKQLMPNQEEGRTKATTGISDGRSDLPEPVV